MYRNTKKSDQLRDLITSTAVIHLSPLLDDEEGEVSQMMEKVGEFGRDIARYVRQSTELDSPNFYPLRVPFSQADLKDAMENCSDAHGSEDRLRSTTKGFLCTDRCGRYRRVDASYGGLLRCLKQGCNMLMKEKDERGCTILYKLEYAFGSFSCMCSMPKGSVPWGCIKCGLTN